jgi:hypothetical protein
MGTKVKRQVPVNPAHYSEQSKNSQSWYNLPGEYQDIQYRCVACGKSEVWSREQQKEDFEVKHRYLHQRRVLCSRCYLRKRELSKALRARQRSCAGNDIPQAELLAWQAELGEYQRLGGRFNSAISNMLGKKLRLAAQVNPFTPGAEAKGTLPHENLPDPQR